MKIIDKLPNWLATLLLGGLIAATIWVPAVIVMLVVLVSVAFGTAPPPPPKDDE